MVKQDFINKLVKIRDSLYYRINNSTCICTICKEDLDMTLEELEELIEEANKKNGG